MAASDERSLYRKYRSRTFADLVGQEHVTQTLRNAVRYGAVGHAYLFTGPRGTGKTSTARILARAVNCLDLRDGEPCNACESCRSMLESRCLDLAEIDAASNSKVDEMRELLDKVGYRPTTVRRKVYIIDEVHMLSTHAFNALLKTLEEPPAHVLFALATTDVHKVPATITSRCQRLDFRIITPPDITARLAYVCEREDPPIQAERAALEMIAQQATGSLRDALSLLEQVRAYEGVSIGVAEVEQALGLARTETLARLTDDIIAGDVGAALGLIDELAGAGADLRQYARQLVQYWRDLMLLCAGGPAALGRGPDERVAAQATRLSVDDVMAVFRAIMQPDYSGRRSASAQWQLELAVIEACRRFGADRGPAPARDALSAARTAVAVPRAAESPQPPHPSWDGGEAPAPVAPEREEQASRMEATERRMADVPVSDPAAEHGRDMASAAVAPVERPLTASRDGRSPQQIWAEVMRLLSATPDKSRVAAVFKDRCVPVGLEGDVFVVGFYAGQGQSFFKDQAEKPSYRAVVQEALSQVIGRAVTPRYDTIKGPPAGAGGPPSASAETFVRRAEREILSVHMERDAR